MTMHVSAPSVGLDFEIEDAMYPTAEEVTNHEWWLMNDALVDSGFYDAPLPTTCHWCGVTPDYGIEVLGGVGVCERVACQDAQYDHDMAQVEVAFATVRANALRLGEVF